MLVFFCHLFWERGLRLFVILNDRWLKLFLECLTGSYKVPCWGCVRTEQSDVGHHPHRMVHGSAKNCLQAPTMQIRLHSTDEVPTLISKAVWKHGSAFQLEICSLRWHADVTLLFFYSIRKGAFSRPFCTVVHCNSSFLLTSTVFSSGHFTEFQSWCLLISCLWFLSPSWTLVLCTDRTLSSCIQSDSGLKACHRDLWRT